MRVLITGGSGFLGAWVIRRLIETGHEPQVMDIVGDRSKVSEIAGHLAARDLLWVVGDIRRQQEVAIAAQNCDAIIHLAGLSTQSCKEDPVRCAEINLIGTLNVFEVARRLGISSVTYASSAEVYGGYDSQQLLPETHYDTLKLAAEGSARAYWEQAGIASVGFRASILYGPQREFGLSAGPNLACRAAAYCNVYSMPFTGSCGMVYAADAAELFVRAAVSPQQGAHVFNLMGEEASVDQIIAEIRHFVPEARLSCSGAQLPTLVSQSETNLNKKFPGRTRTSLADGLKATILFYQNQSAGSRSPAGVSI
jgi:UDP-glucose 4-epimerase